jgi:hypothetical protein
MTRCTRVNRCGVGCWFSSLIAVCIMCRRPGILVLINDTDWELEGGLSYVVQNNDTIVFISTLHGG